MNIRKHIPNTITCLNLVSGCIASVMAFRGFIWHAIIWIIIAAVLDFFDGFAARLLKAYSPIGKDLDSLADVVSFGVAPGMMVYWLLDKFADLGDFKFYSIGIFAFIIPALSAVRLAKFNNDTRQTESFIGLPVPAHALFWASVVYYFYVNPSLIAIVPARYWIVGIIIAVIGVSLLLISEIPMFSLKVKSLAWKGNELRYILILAAVAFFALFGLSGIALTILLYILISWLTGHKQ